MDRDRTNDHSSSDLSSRRQFVAALGSAVALPMTTAVAATPIVEQVAQHDRPTTETANDAGAR